MAAMAHADPHPLTEHALRIATDTARALAADASARGLAVAHADGRRAIPLGLVPVVLERAQIERRRSLATHLVAATAKAAHWRLAHDRATVDSALSPAEARYVRAHDFAPARLAVARVDCLVADLPHALEVNATIPAMQGYSDIAVEAWLEHVAGEREGSRLARANGSNAAALYEALQESHRIAHGAEARTIALLCRRGDSQIGELEYLVARFQALGGDARIVHPDELDLRDGWLHAHGVRCDVLYRHVFLSRLDVSPAPALDRALAVPAELRTVLRNTPAPHLEMKSTLALLSRCAAEAAFAARVGLTDDELAAIAATLPWTRLLRAGPARLADGNDATDLVAHVAANREAYVVKRAWSYGGVDVHVGSAIEPTAWAQLVRDAARDARGGGFVVQQAIVVPRTRQRLATPDRVIDGDVVTDYSAFASPGLGAAWGGVCRAAPTAVVNIAGGGGVVPLLARDVADRVLAALAGRDSGAHAE